MKYLLPGLLIIFLIVSLDCNITFADESPLSSANIKQYLKTKKIPKAWLSVDESHVDFPIIKILQAYASDQNFDPVAAINVLEPVMTRTRFELKKPDEDAFRSYFLWRDLMYTLLSRSFYEIGDALKANKFAGAVSEDSPFYRISKIQQVWINLKTENYTEAQRLIDLIQKMNPDSLELVELKLQSAFLLFQEKKYDLAITEAESVQPTPVELKSYRSKLLAQAYFEIHQLNVSDSGDIKKNRLEKIIGFLQEVPKSGLLKRVLNSENSQVDFRNQQSQFAYFSAEVHWTYASLLRIQDPVKYHKQIMAALNNADTFIRPWVERSREEKKALLPEEALFLSSVILWEQNKILESIPRLLLTIDFYPGTQYKEDIYQLIGDYYYDRGQYQDSITYYSLLSRSENLEKVSYGIYKAAWAFYNLKEKFKALRHFQRLVLHYKKDKLVLEQAPGTVYHEAEIDMFIVMAELLSAQESLKELEIFKYSNADWDDVRDKMASTFKKLGKFEESILVLKDLLAQHSQNDKYYTWLYEVLINQLNIGLRSDIAPTIETYLSAKEYQGTQEDFENKITNLQLILHREAIKTDDIEIWKATDSMYKVISQLSPNSKNGDFWYFGAQRKEMKGQAWEAVAWYKKAIGVNNYTHKKDAAVSVLRIVQSQFSQAQTEQTQTAQTQSANDEDVDTVSNYQNCKEGSAWYIENFQGTDQIFTANQLYLKSLFYLREYSLAEDFILTSLEKSKLAKPDWDNYLSYNKNIYAQKEWLAAFNLADRLIQGLSAFTEDQHLFISEIRQESAFQIAYQFESEEKDRDLVKAREWYGKSIEINKNNENLKVKAWNNLLRTYLIPTEIDLFDKNYEKFKSESFTKLTEESRLLLIRIFDYVGKSYEEIGYPLKRFEVLLHSSQFVLGEAQALMRWNALIGFGTHYDVGNFNRSLELLNGKSILEETSNKITLARLHFLLGQYDQAWVNLQEIWSSKKINSAFFVLVRDFYVNLESTNSPLFVQMQDWLDRRDNLSLKQEPVLEGLWTRRKWLAILKSMNEKPNREIASVESLPNGEIESPFDRRLGQVSRILKGLVENKQKIKQKFGKSHPRLVADGICRQAEESQRAVRELESQREPSIESEKWEHFLVKLNGKISELEAEAQSEFQLCRNRQEEVSLMDTLQESKSPICSLGKCPSRMPAGDVEKIKRESSRRQENGLDLVYQLIMSGAWATAEYYAEQISDRDLKLLSIAYLRLAYNDRKSTFLILKELSKSPLKSHRALFSALVAWSEQAYKKMQMYLDEVDTSALSSWEKDYFSMMQNRSDLAH